MTTQGLTGHEWRPNLIIAGLNKCGTTELCDYLSKHPDILLPFVKQPNTFWDLPKYLTKYPLYFSGDRTYWHYSNIIKLIPDTVSSILDEDFIGQASILQLRRG